MSDIQHYRENGYILIKNFFPKEKIDQIRDQAKEIFLLQLKENGLVDSTKVSEKEFEEALYKLFQRDHSIVANCGKHIQHMVSLHQLSLDEKLINKLKELGIEFPVISTRPVLYFNTPHLAKKEVYNKLTPHQDWRSMQGSLDSMIVWMPLVDIDVALGALEVVPGSHKDGLIDSQLIDGYGKLAQEKFDNYKFVPVEVEKGDALFFSSFLVHQSGNNVTESIRWSCHFRFNNMYEPTFIKRHYPHPYIYKPQEELITPGFPATEQVVELFTSK
jgi:phytanoyl-CoA hydroxylase